MNELPNFFQVSDRIQTLMSPAPISKLDYSFDQPDLTNFLPVYDGMIESGNLFKYEDYNFLHDGRVANNLTECRNLYAKTDAGWQFLRRERMKTGQNLNFTVHNKTVGWFPEIKENFPDFVSVCDNFIAKYDIDVWKILIFKVDMDLVWHMDMDGYYGFRLFMGHDDWTLKFRAVKPEYKEQLRSMTWMGQWNEVNNSIPTTCEPDDILYTQEQTGQAFLIDSMNYVHYFENSRPQYGVLVKGVV
jgi:hypothetical protein